MSDPGGRELVVAMRGGGDAGEIYKVKPTEPDAGPDGGGSRADVEPPPSIPAWRDRRNQSGNEKSGKDQM